MRQKLGLLPAAEFHFLAQSRTFTCASLRPRARSRRVTLQRRCDGIVESDAWAEMIASMVLCPLTRSCPVAL